MKINKQKFLKISLGITMMLASIQPSITLAEENFPSRSMKLVVGYAAGGPADTLARLVAEGMSSELGQTMIVENRPGAASAIAASYVAKSPADGYTLIWGASSPMVMNPIIRDDLDYDPINDFDQLGMIAD